MAHFPLSIDLTGKRVLLVGSGPMAEEKWERLQPFGPDIRRLEHLIPEDLEPQPEMVVVAELPHSEKIRISQLCRQQNIPVNVVDVPELCTFYFPALVTRGDLTVSVSTAGKSPAAAAYWRRQLEAILPENTAQIIAWAHALRQSLPPHRRRSVLCQAVPAAFSRNHPLTEAEIAALFPENTPE